MKGLSVPAAAVSVDPGAVVLAILAWVALVAVLYVWLALGLSRIFRKVGMEPWRGWVPVLNLATLLELGGYVGWIALAVLVPGAGVLVVWVFVVLAAHRVGRSFGYGPGMTVLAALVLPAWATVVGFGPARWLARLPGHRAPQGGDQPVPLTRRAARPDDTARPAAASVSARTPPPLPSAPAAAAAAHRATFSGALPTVGGLGGPAFPPTAASGHRGMAWSGGAPASSPPVSDGTGHASAASWSSFAPSPAPAPGPGTVTPAAASATTPEDWSRRARRDAASAAGPGVPAPAASGPAAPAAPDGPLVTALPTDWADAAPAGVRAASPAIPVAPAEPPPLHQPRYSPWSPDELDDLPDEVSAVQTIPGVGAPRAARSAVSAQHARAEVPDDEETVVVVRRRAAWELVLPLGPPVPITGRCVILGRRPAPDPEFPDAQLVPIVDETRTVSKRHARLELRDEAWWIVDLDSTNGVVLAPADDTEIDLVPGVPHHAGDRFLLGDAEVRIQRGPGG